MKTLTNTYMIIMEKNQNKMKKKEKLLEASVFALLTVVTASLVLLIYNLLMLEG